MNTSLSVKIRIKNTPTMYIADYGLTVDGSDWTYATEIDADVITCADYMHDIIDHHLAIGISVEFKNCLDVDECLANLIKI